MSLFVMACGNRTDEKSNNATTSKPVTKLETETINNTDPTEAATAVNENYESYSGIWTEEGLKKERIIENGGSELTITIQNHNELQGSLYSKQEMTDRIAYVTEMNETIEDGQLYYPFKDDGWGGTGTLHIQFDNDMIQIEVLDYKLADDNRSGYGISGIYQLLRERVTDDDKNDTKNNQIENSLELSEEELQNAIYEKYYKPWTEEEMITAINERSQYLLKSAYAKEVSYFWENIREVTDIANVVEPLYHTDMKFYTEKDFENAPPLIIYLAKNEIYARHGYIFKNEDLNNYFMGQIWYKPIFVADEFDDSAFNQYEKTNLDLLSKLDTYDK